VSVIFIDLDDTLINTSERHYTVYKDILESFGVSTYLSKEEFWRLKRDGRKTVDLVPPSIPRDVFQSEWIEKIEDRCYLNLDKIIDGCHRVLSQLTEQGHKIVLVTLRQRKDNLFWELNKLGLTNYFDEIIVGSTLHLKTKVPLIKRYLDMSILSSSIIVGDSEIDILTGKQLGIVTIAVMYGVRSLRFLKKYIPDFYLDHLSKLPKIISRIDIDSAYDSVR